MNRVPVVAFAGEYVLLDEVPGDPFTVIVLAVTEFGDMLDFAGGVIDANDVGARWLNHEKNRAQRHDGDERDQK
ncbi:hypothetical protein D9M69_632680 [compost metagenome]